VTAVNIDSMIFIDKVRRGAPYEAIFKSEILIPKYETISKFKFSKPVPDRFRNTKQPKKDYSSEKDPFKSPCMFPHFVLLQ
jgi:hypothetical protein